MQTRFIGGIIIMPTYNTFKHLRTYKLCIFVLLLLQENRFTKCDVCTMVKRELEKTIDSVKRGELKSVLAEHNKLQM